MKWCPFLTYQSQTVLRVIRAVQRFGFAGAEFADQRLQLWKRCKLPGFTQEKKSRVSV